MLDDVLESLQISRNGGLAILGIGVFAVWIIRTSYQRYQSSRELKLPLVRFEDGDDSRQRYVTESPTLFQIGYDKYLKHGQPFAMRNFVDDLRPQVFMPLKYLAEVKSAPETKLSFPYFSLLLFSQDHTGMAKQTAEAAHVLRLELNRSLHLIYPGLERETAAAIDLKFPRNAEETQLHPYGALAYVIARISALVIAGPELCHNDEYLNLCINVSEDSMHAAHDLRANWPKWARPFARFFSAPIKKILADRQRAADILRPVLEARQAEADAAPDEDKPGYSDGIQWLMDYYQARGRKLTPYALAQNEMFYALASIHSNTASTLSILWDLLDDRQKEARQLIMEEIDAVRREHTNWTRPALSKLVKLDSFMKESQRLHFVGHARVTRAAQVDYTFKDGFTIPKGTMIQFPHGCVQGDADYYENPGQFDPWRFLRKRQNGVDANKFQFASLSDTETNFGAGFHACPARNYATDAIKFILIYLLTNYDIKFDGEAQVRPPDIIHDSATLPDVTKAVLIRAKTVN